MKIELTIKTTYMPSWGVWEGIRELVQNGRDAEVEHSAPLTVRHRESDVLVIENVGTTLPYEALLLGHTSKSQRVDLIGKFGEGLKLGCLALVRAGYPVRIRSGSEVWVPAIQKSEKFQADVLVFDIQKGRKADNRVAVEIGNVDAESWEKMQELFLFLKGSIKDEECVQTYNGGLLLAERFHGKVYVKGIFVQNDPRLQYGYDLYDADIDRDRKMVAKYDLQYRTNTIWRDALGKRPDLVADFAKLLDREAADVEGIDDWNAGFIPEVAKKALAALFRARHGDNALPVSSLSESAEIEHLGKRGIVCPKPLRAILEKELGNASANKAKLREEVTQTYGWHDLVEGEKANLLDAIRLVNGVEPVSLESVDVVGFRDPNLEGMFRDGRILVAKRLLENHRQTLTVMVHEAAHRQGGDGEKGHVENLERIWSGIVANLLGAS